MRKLSETELKKLIKGGETNTVEFKVTAPEPQRWQNGYVVWPMHKEVW